MYEPKNCILFSIIVLTYCEEKRFCDGEKNLFEAEGREFAEILRKFILTVKGQNNF
jgi:hypothetical protein